jgi:multidrug efflux pump subunit AcrA (membrane-fusion protein)
VSRTARFIKKAIIRTSLLVVLLGGVYAGYRALQALPTRAREIATTKVLRGDVVVRSYTRGELRAVRSVTLSAPNLFGTVQVTHIAPLGAFAREKDLVVEFDDSEVRSRLEEKQLELDQIGEQIKKAQADLAMRNNQDQVDLLGARYGVRRAELEVQRNELLSNIDAKKNLLNLEEAKRKLKQLESDIKSRQEQALAEIAVLQEKKNKGVLELQREKDRLLQVKLLAPMSGLVAIKQNRTGFMFPGMQIPDIREGDQVQPGMPVADVLDLSEMEAVAKVGELDRANLKEGQEATLVLDALPEKKLHGVIKTMSGTASSNIFSFDPAKKFDVVFSIDMKELLSALGAKPDQIRKILATAEQNRKKPTDAPPLMMGQTPPGTPPPAAAGGPAPARPAAPPPNQMADTGGQRPAQDTPRPMASAGGPPMMAFTSRPKYTEQDMANAKLPPPPEEDTQFDVLLRPGLLADVEITVEKVPNAIHVPMQAVFEKDGKPTVFVRTGSGFEPRAIKPLKRSESTMVIAEGVRPGEIVALADPTVKPGSNKDKKSDKGAMGALPGGAK